MNDSRIKQIGIYVGKNFRIFKNEKGWKNLIFAFIIALLVSVVQNERVFVYTSDTWSGMFTIVSACIWVGLFNSIQSICKERAIIKREHRSGLHMSSYLLAHAIYQAVLCMVEALIITAVTAVFLDYPQKALLGNTYFEYYVTYWLLLFGSDLLGLAVSSIVKDSSTAMTVMPFVLIFQLIFSGALFTLSGPASRISDLTLTKWGLQSTCTAADYNNLGNSQLAAMQQTIRPMARSIDPTISDEAVDSLVAANYTVAPIPEYEFSVDNLKTQWGMILRHCAAYIVIAVISLEFIDRDKR